MVKTRNEMQGRGSGRRSQRINPRPAFLQALKTCLPLDFISRDKKFEYRMK
jgi:hypothetical protein